MLFVGALYEIKGIDIFIKITEIIRGKYVGINFIVFGDGSQEEELSLTELALPRLLTNFILNVVDTVFETANSISKPLNSANTILKSI